MSLGRRKMAEQETIKEIKDKIYLNYSLDDQDKTIVEKSLESGINFDRIKTILDLIIQIRLDKSSVLGFLAYQHYKVFPDKNEEIYNLLNDEERQMFADYKTIRDISTLTLSEEIDDIRKMFIIMGQDLRVVIIKLCGIYYDIKTLNLPLNDDEWHFVKQVKEVHVPLCERLGLDSLKQNLADNVVRLSNPDEYKRLLSTVESKKEENEKQLELTRSKLQAILDDLKINGEIICRIKHISSIFNKLHNKNVSIDKIYDILAMRVIVDTVDECYAILGRIHAIYKPMIGRVKDYIANPKPNGYKSLHTTIIVDNQHPLEVQIRTREMHKEAEYGGVCAHWLYKEKKDKKNDFDNRLTWFRQIIENAKNMSNEDFIDTLKSELYNGVIVVQTPKGRVIEFPEGSTVIDFAYAIHTDIGNTCVGAKINGKLKPLTTTLSNGDIVEILTNVHSKGPSRDWLKIVKTSSAKSKIKAFFKSELKDENVKLGKSMFNQAVQDKGLIPSQLLIESYTKEIFKRINVDDVDEMYAGIGSGSLSANNVVNRFINLLNIDKKKIAKIENVVHLKRNKEGVLIDGDSGMLVRFAGCCNPIEGDDIVGYISRGKGVAIHRKNCPNLNYLEKERLLSATWQIKENTTFTTNVKVIAEKANNNIAKLTTLLTGLKAIIKGFDAKDVGDNFVCTLILEVKNIAELNSIINSIKNMKNVTSVYRSE